MTKTNDRLILTKSTYTSGDEYPNDALVWTVQSVSGYRILGEVAHIDEWVARAAMAGMASRDAARKGGAARSKAKTGAARKNGAKGGRPRLVK